MAFRGRRRRPSVAWFPNLGTEYPDSGGTGESRLSGLQFTIDPDTTGLNALQLPLTFDKPIDEVDAAGFENQTLADLQGSAYRLRRIVGNIQVGLSWPDTGGADPGWSAVLFGAALAVIPWDDRSNTPEADVDPIDADDIREPWIWRKTLVLGQQVINRPTSVGQVSKALSALPATSSYYPQSRFEYLDQKTARVITGDTRLCLVIGCAYLGAFDAAPFTPTVAGYFDYRILGSLRKASGKGGVVR